MTVSDLHDWLSEITKKSEPVAQVKNQQIVISDSRAEFASINALINEEYLEKAISEFILNACKFSVDESTIYILLNAHKHKIHMSISNKPLVQSGVNGVPPEYERLVLEPFFRIAQGVDDRYKSLDFGLGLTLASKIINKHDGKVNVTNMQDHLTDSKDDQIRVAVNIEIPIDEGTVSDEEVL